MSLNVEYVNVFIQATQSMLKDVCQLESTLGKVYLKESPYCSDSIAIIIGIVGDIRGQIIFSMSIDAARFIASKMMMGMPVPELDEMAKSAISELTNMTLGSTATLFFNRGVTVDITPPSLLMGQNMQISTTKMKTISIPIHFEDYTMEIDVAVQESNK